MFLQSTNAPEAYRNSAVAALHGSWNRSAKTGYKVILFPWDQSTQLPGDQIDLVTGWLTGGSNWGRPVDVAVAPDGGIYISDDAAGAIYKLSYMSSPPPPPPSGSVASLTFSCTRFTCSFNGSGSSGATSWSWTFSDGGSASGSTVSHTFAKKGTYTATLSTQPAGSQSTTSKPVRCNPKGC